MKRSVIIKLLAAVMVLTMMIGCSSNFIIQQAFGESIAKVKTLDEMKSEIRAQYGENKL